MKCSVYCAVSSTLNLRRHCVTFASTQEIPLVAFTRPSDWFCTDLLGEDQFLSCCHAYMSCRFNKIFTVVLFSLALCLYYISCYLGLEIGARVCVKSRGPTVLQEAAQRRMEFQLGSFAEPIYKGDFPESVKQRIAYLPKITPQQVFSSLPFLWPSLLLKLGCLHKGWSLLFQAISLHVACLKNVAGTPMDD